MKWVNPPVAFMLHAGVPRLLNAGVYMPGLQPASQAASKVALEAYPGLLAREVLGWQASANANWLDARDRETGHALIFRPYSIPSTAFASRK